MAVQGDGAGADHQIFALAESADLVTDNFTIGLQFRLESDLDRVIVLLAIVKYISGADAHVLATTGNGTSLVLYSNYGVETSPVIIDLVPGTKYTVFIKGSGTTLTITAYEEDDDTKHSQTVSQTAFTPDRYFLFAADAAGDESAHATVRWIRGWTDVLSDVEEIAERDASTPAKTSGLSFQVPFTGGNLSNALTSGSGLLFQEDGGGVTYVEWEEAGPPKTITLDGSADIDLENPLPTEGVDPPVITDSTLPSGQIGVAYSHQLTITGDGPITVTADGLPAGLSMLFSGEITGTPTSPNGAGGTFLVMVTAVGPGGTTNKQFSLSIAGSSVALPTITTGSIPSGTVGQNYSVTFAASGTGPFVWEYQGLPPGITFSGPTLSGIHQLAGAHLIGVRVAGAGGFSPWKFFTMEVAPPFIPERTYSAWAPALKTRR